MYNLQKLAKRWKSKDLDHVSCLVRLNVAKLMEQGYDEEDATMIVTDYTYDKAYAIVVPEQVNIREQLGLPAYEVDTKIKMNKERKQFPSDTTHKWSDDYGK